MLKLRLLTGPRAGRQLRVSDTKPISIGRRKGRLRLHDSRVSKNHAEIYFANDLWILRDLDSANGTYVNRKKVRGLVELESGDMVQMGRVLFKIVRCDGIGMDTPTGLDDDLLDAAVPGLGSSTRGPALDHDDDDDDLDLDDFLGESSREDLSDDSDLLPGISEAQSPDTTAPPVDAIDDALGLDEDEDDALGLDESDAKPEPIDAAFDTPADDDDSFFDDIGESTDAIGSVGGAVTDEQIEEAQSEQEQAQTEQEQEQDPFLSNQPADESEADVADESSDKISLDDEAPTGPGSAGTTLLTAISHDDLADDANEASDAQALASNRPGDEYEEKEYDEDDEQAPALVGLHLDHAPPQQPKAIEPDDTPDAEPEQEQEQEQEPVAQEQQAEPEPEPDTPEVAADVTDQVAPLVEADSEEPSDTFIALADDAAVDEPEDDVAQATVDDAVDEAGQALVEDADDDPIVAADIPELHQALTELSEEPDDPAMDDLIAELTEDDAAEIEDKLDAELETETEDEITIELEDEQAQPVAELDAAIDAEPEADDESPQFDIDAAFDALSQGLDDSVVLPAIESQDEKNEQSEQDALSEQPDEDALTEPPQAVAPADSVEPVEPTEPAAATDESPDPLAGSQLDVSFIKDALAKLEEDTPDQTADDTQPKAQASDPTPPTTPPTDTYLQSTPPGLNPTSILPPVEPGSSRPPAKKNTKKGMWFLTILLTLVVVGGGGVLIGQNYDRFIAGRDDINPTPNPRTNPGNTRTTPPGDTPIDGQGQAPVIPTPPDDDTTTEHIGPNPFDVGPGVIGAGVLDGLTRSDQDGPTLDPIRQPTNNTPPAPDTIRVPQQPSTNTPDTKPPQAVVPNTDNPAPANTPAIDKSPARIVFLVDASGSLVDSLPQMLIWLKEAMQTIEPDEQFAIYFFKDGKPTGVKPEGLVSPKRDILAQIEDNWLTPSAAPILPSGRSNPTQALAHALSLKPTDLYILSDDAFAKHKGDTTAKEAIDLVKQLIGEQDVRVHGVQFFYRSDQSILETLANQYDGTYDFIRERIAPDDDPIDLLEEFGGE